MKCGDCGGRLEVYDSRTTEDFVTRRLRKCLGCGLKVRTVELPAERAGFYEHQEYVKRLVRLTDLLRDSLVRMVRGHLGPGPGGGDDDAGAVNNGNNNSNNNGGGI